MTLKSNKILVGCEESQTVTQAMRSIGLNAYSCDLEPTRGDPTYHIQGCVKDALRLNQWGLAVLHPPWA